MTQITRVRNAFYDEMKGIAILLVVIGHSIQSIYPESFDYHVVFKLIYSFHMPLFMFISGMVSFNQEESYSFDWLIRRFKSLLIPFITWIVLPYFFSHEWVRLGETLKNVIKSPDYGLWFLWILFLNSIILFVIFKFRFLPHEISAFMAIIVLRVLTKYVHILGTGLLEWYFVFYIAGHFVAKYKTSLMRYKYYIGIIGTALWIILVPFWRRGENPTFYQYFEGLTNSKLMVLLILLYNYTVAFSGILMGLLFGYVIKNTPLLRFFKEIGKRTIEIYALQWFFFGLLTIGNNTCQVICNVVTGLFLPIIISILLENGKARLLLFGKC